MFVVHMDVTKPFSRYNIKIIEQIIFAALLMLNRKSVDKLTMHLLLKEITLSVSLLILIFIIENQLISILVFMKKVDLINKKAGLLKGKKERVIESMLNCTSYE